MIDYILRKIQGADTYFKIRKFKKKMGYCGQNVVLSGNIICQHPENIYMYDNSHIFGPFRYIGKKGKLIIKSNSGSAQGLTVIANGHLRTIGKLFLGGENWEGRSLDLDVIIEEDVWIGANVTILGQSTIGRGATIGAGCVIRHSIPRYAIVVGNPDKIIGFCYTPEEMIEHESNLYPDEDRTDYDEYVKLYNKYYLSCIKEIRAYLSLKIK